MRYIFGECTLDTEQYILYRATHSIALQPKAFQVLHYLLTHRERVIAKAELNEQVWPEQFISDATLEGVIKAVRQAVGDDGRTQWCIQTRRGQGYRFIAPLADPAVRQEEEAVSGEAPVPVSSPLRARLPAAPPSTVPETSRRQLTVLFCDLIDSTPLAVQLDPEDLRAVMLAYYAACTEVAQRFDGTIVQYLGDGLLLFFAYPQAHEDAAQRAIHTGLGMLEALTTLNTRLHHEHGVHLTARLGIHTGMVIVGQGAEHGGAHPMAFGDTPHIAARLQTLASANQVVISEPTWRLAGGGFDYDDLGVQTLRGVATPLRVYHVRGTRGVVSRFDAATVSGLSALVGREEEVRLILRRWQQAQAGEGQVVLLAGEAGMGKSRLARAVRETVATEPHTAVAYQCVPHYRHSAFYPLRVQLEDAAQFARHDTDAQKLDKLERLLAHTGADVADVAPLFAALLSLPMGDCYPALSLAPRRQRAKTIEALVGQMVGLAACQPVLYMVEDVQWSDPTTLEVLDLLVHRVHTIRALVIITFRPEFAAPWRAATHVTALTLNRLDRAQSTVLVEQVTTGKALPAAVVSQIVAQADGMPLFVEELTKAVMESKWLAKRADGYELLGPLPLPAIPATLQDTLTERLDRLGTAKTVAQLAATIGREFSAALLQALLPADADALQDALTRLVEAEIIYPRGMHPDATYVFKHVLIQETAYYSLLRNTRQGYHREIAQVLAAQFSDTATTQPELLAHHYTEAGLMEEATGYWQQAGRRARERAADQEAIVHCTKGLEVLQALPEGPARAQQELDLLITWATALQITKGYAASEVGHAWNRTRELCRHVGDTSRLYEALAGLGVFYQNRGEYQTAWELGEQSFALAQRLRDTALLLRAHYWQGTILYYLGEFASAHTHLKQASALSQTDDALTFRHANSGVPHLAHVALVLWIQGYPEQALRKIHEMLTYAQGLYHPYNLARAWHYAATLHVLRREWSTAEERATAALTMSAELGFTQWVGLAMLSQGWALAAQGKGEVAIAKMHQGLATRQATGAVNGRSASLVRLAEAYGRIGQAEEGLCLLAEALVHVNTTGERYYEAELYRIKGELLLQQTVPDATQGEACFQRALDVAHCQQAKSWELRAAISLSRLWQRQGKCKDAHDLLAPLYSWFTEGFDTADLQEAKALIEVLLG